MAKLFSSVAGGDRVLDLLFHLPNSYIDRRERSSIATALPGRIVTLEVQILRIEPPGTDRQPTRVVITDSSGFGEIIFFNRFPAARLPVGSAVLISGKFDERRQMVHPDQIAPADKPEQMPPVEPVWPLTAGLFPGHFRRPIAEALSRLPDFPEWHDAALMRRERWPSFAEALRALQTPSEPPSPVPRRRLAYDELLADQVSIALVRRRARERPGRPLVGDGRLRSQALATFGHRLTPSQQQALTEIDADLAAPRRMACGCCRATSGAGKTLVAVLAMLRAVEAGAQAALMAPTEILARQHYRTLEKFSPVPTALLPGAIPGRARAEILAGLATGNIPVIVGTHALFQQSVEFSDLGLAVIDEQHRFGVDQRLLMGGCGKSADATCW